MGMRVGKGGLAVAGLIALGFTIGSALLLEQGKRLAYDLVVRAWIGAWLPVLGIGGLWLAFMLGNIVSFYLRSRSSNLDTLR